VRLRSQNALKKREDVHGLNNWTDGNSTGTGPDRPSPLFVEPSWLLNVGSGSQQRLRTCWSLNIPQRNTDRQCLADLLCPGDMVASIQECAEEQVGTRIDLSRPLYVYDQLHITKDHRRSSGGKIILPLKSRR